VNELIKKRDCQQYRIMVFLTMSIWKKIRSVVHMIILQTNHAIEYVW